MWKNLAKSLDLILKIGFFKLDDLIARFFGDFFTKEKSLFSRYTPNLIGSRPASQAEDKEATKEKMI